MAEQGRAGQSRAGLIAAVLAIVAAIIGGAFYWQSRQAGPAGTPVTVTVVPPAEKPAAPAPAAPAAPKTEPPNTETAAASPPAAPAAPAPAAAPAPPAASPAPAAEPQAPAAAPAPAAAAAPAQVAPSFDVVRVEPDGSTVVAGRADPNAKVEVLDGAQTVAKGVASDGGDWAMTLDKPLPPGPHDLSLRTTSPDGKTETLSQQSVAVSVPETPKTGPLVVLDQPDAAAKVLQAPAAVAKAPTGAAAGATAAARPAVTVDAVAFQDGKLYISGSAAIGGTIRVYVDGVVVGDATVDENGHWQITTERSVGSGQHDIRADQIDGPSGHVVARAEVPFEQNGDVATLMAVKTEGGGTGGAASDGNLPEPKRVIIRRGDNLWTISRRLYGKGVRFSTIYEANSDQIRNPDLIYPGQVFLLPAGDMRWQTEPPVTR